MQDHGYPAPPSCLPSRTTIRRFVEDGEVYLKHFEALRGVSTRVRIAPRSRVLEHFQPWARSQRAAPVLGHVGPLWVKLEEFHDEQAGDERGQDGVVQG